jgi:hypothetical protein
MNRSTFTGWTKPPRTSRKLASPDAEMTSRLLGVRREERYASSERPEDLRVDLASARVLEVVNPVDGLVRRAVLDVARPGQDV